ncbi:tRNA dihydrouridine synthase DusB [Xanthobacter wiegelii]|uniref:tRNA dihydrouridine synthase DusB n=1 Tax=Xanthobacter wiegelii TaxID=3119913 RepID=UPI00372CB36D
MQETVPLSIPALRLGAATLPNPVILAPMAGITDAPVRRMAVRHGAGLVISEMLASEALLEGNPEMLLRAEGEGVSFHAVQIAGNDPRLMGEAARVAQAAGAGLIDINMGCPAKRVTTGAAGAALLRDLPLARAIFEAVRGAVSVPVTVKTRLGWDDGSPTAVALARMAEACGLSMVTIHGRTRCQFYTGHADWTAIRAVKDAVSIPVIANGDVVHLSDGPAILAASGADGLMIGRGAQGRPWFPGRVAQTLAGQKVDEDPPIEIQRDILLELYEGWLSLYGTALGVRQARKHVGWALEAANAGQGPERAAFVARWRKALLVLDEPGRVKNGIMTAYDELMWRAAA